MTDFNPGSILINTANNKLYGVLVTTLHTIPNNKIIVFRLDKNTNPIFSKFQVHPNIAKVGIINEHQYANIKSALLKYYRTYNLTPTEKTMLKSLMDFAFPLGIPEYQPHIDLPERDIQLMDLHSRLIPGTRIFINTPNKSTYSHLDGKTLDIIDKTENGLWTNLPTSEQDINKLGNTMHFLFYKNAEIPTFGGISRIVPIIDNNSTDTTDINKDSKINEVILEAFKKLKEQDSLTTTMEYNGEKVRVVPKNAKVIFPEIFQNMTYNPKTDSFTIDPSLITSSMASKLGDKLMISRKDSKGNMMEMIGADNELVFNNKYNDEYNDNYNTINNHYKTNLNLDGELSFQDGGSRNKDKGKDNDKSGNNNFEEELNEIERDEKALMKYSKYSNNLYSLRNTIRNIDDTDVIDEFEDENNENDEHNKHIGKNKFSNDEYDDISDLINGFIPLSRGKIKGANTGAKMQDKNDNSDNSEKSDTTDIDDTDIETDYDEEDITEIVDANDIEELETFEKVKRVEINDLERILPESIQKGDLHKYKNEQLTNLERKDETILNNITKHINIISLLKHKITGEDNNIIFTPQNYKPLVSKYIKGDFTNKFLIPLVINKKKIYLDKSKQGQKDEYDPQTHEVIDDYYTSVKNLIYLQDKKNNTLNNDAYTNSIITELNPNTSISQNDNIGMLFRLGSEIPADDYAHICQDTLTIKYCDKPIKCQSYSLNPMNFDYQINLGPMGRFIDEDDEQYGQDLENSTKEENREYAYGDKGDYNNSNNNDKYLNEENEDNDDNVDNNKNILYNKPLFKTYYRGDTINIIGYVRPPLKYFNYSTEYLLSNLYSSQKNHNEVVTVNINDINPEISEENNFDIDIDIDEDKHDEDKDDEDKHNKTKELKEIKTSQDEDMQQSISIHPDKFVLFLLPQEGTNFDELGMHIEKIIPSIDELIKLYLNKSNNNTFEHIYNVLDKFEYDYKNIALDMYNKLMDKHEETVEIYKTINEEISLKYEDYKTDLIATKKEKEKLEKDKSYKKSDPKFKYITDDILNDISKFYYDKYDNKGISIDTDDIRLKWIMKSFDNGKYFFKTLFINYLKMYQESHNLENLETEMAILKEKHAMINTNSQMESSSTNQYTNQNTSCNAKITGPNVIKYPSLPRLEQDNGKVAVDSDGNVIMLGDYALVDVNNSKQLYKREIIGSIDMWIKEDMGVLYKLIQEKKNKCLANPEIKLEDANKCLFDIEQLKCEVNDEFDMTKQSIEMELHLNNLQKEIDYIKHIPILLAKINKEIINDRLALINKVNSMKQYWKFKEEEEKKLTEHNEKLRFANKPCIHYDVTDYFFKIKNDNERYEFARIILKQFLNTEPQYKSDYNNFNKEGRDKNYAFCNICNQELLCNHFRLGVSYLENETNVDYNTISTIFGLERNGSFFCRVDGCNELIDTTEILDLDDFAKGEDAGRNNTRELAENTPYIDKQKEYLNKMINKLLDGENTAKKDELIQRINIYKIIKRLSNIDSLSVKDEIEIINFLKTYQFETRLRILESLVAKIGKNDIAMLKKLVEKFYIKYLISDIGARFLITLQTSATIYTVSNKDCSSNIIGYPIISDISALDGINFIMCIFSQMAVLPEYVNLSDLQRQFLIDRIKKQVEEDSLVKDKIYNAISNKAEEIDNMNSFYLYKTNYWKQFTPRLENININWSPEKILNAANLKEVTYKTYNRMLEVGQENSVYYSLCLMDNINKIILNSDRSNNKELANFCCMDLYNNTISYKYMDFFKKHNSDVNKNIKDFIEVNNIIDKIKSKKIYPSLNIIYDPLYKPSQTIFKLNFNVSQEEIKQIYLKYIDNGLYKGKLHIYDRYNRCILSNEKKIDIDTKTYSMHDYTRIESVINSSNQIKINKIDEKNIYIENIETIKLDELIDKIPKLEIMTFIKDYIVKIKESVDDIFGNPTHPTHSTHSTNPNHPKKKADIFDIYRHISYLNSQIEIEIKDLITKITITDKNIIKYSKIMSNIGNYSKHYEEYMTKLDETGSSNNNGKHIDIKHIESENIYNSNLYRYSKKEEHIQNTIKFLNDVISQIKNGELSNPLNKEHIRQQYRTFLQYGENIKLFKVLSINTREIYNFARLFKSKHKYKIFFPEMVSSILQYLNIISLVNLFNELDNSKLNKKTDIYNKTQRQNQNKSQTQSRNLDNQTGELIDYNFRTNIEPDESLKDLNREMNLGIETDDYEDETLIESLEIKNNNTNLKIISGFIISYLEKINDTQLTYDELTNEKINLLVTTHDQKLRNSNLKGFEWLHKSGNEAERQLVFLQMHKLKKLKYADLAKYLLTKTNNSDFNSTPLNENEIDIDIDNDYDDKENDENDEYEGEVEQDVEYDENGNQKERIDMDIDMEEMGQVFDEEENEEGDQDYGYQAVDDGDYD